MPSWNRIRPSFIRNWTLCLGVFETGLDGGLEGLGVRTDDLPNALVVLEEEEGGHGADAELLGNVGDLVHVKLVEAGFGVGIGESVE